MWNAICSRRQPIEAFYFLYQARVQKDFAKRRTRIMKLLYVMEKRNDRAMRNGKVHIDEKFGRNYDTHSRSKIVRRYLIPDAITVKMDEMVRSFNADFQRRSAARFASRFLKLLKKTP